MIVEVRELPRKRADLTSDGKDSRERVFYVKVDSAADDVNTVTTHASIPERGDAHPEDGRLICRRIHAEHAGFGNFLWRVGCQYEQIASDQQTLEKQSVPDPLDRSAHIEIDFVGYERVVEKYTVDEGDPPEPVVKAIRNSAGDKFDPPWQEPDQRVRIRVRKNMTTWPSFLFSFRNKVNDDVVTIRGISFAARTLKFFPGGVPDFQIENGVTFLPVEFVLEHRRETWDAVLLDCGFNRLDGSTKRPIEVDGERPAVPQLLDGAGAVLADDADPHFLTFATQEQEDFSALPLT